MKYIETVNLPPLEQGKNIVTFPVQMHKSSKIKGLVFDGSRVSLVIETDNILGSTLPRVFHALRSQEAIMPNTEYVGSFAHNNHFYHLYMQKAPRKKRAKKEPLEL